MCSAAYFVSPHYHWYWWWEGELPALTYFRACAAFVSKQLKFILLLCVCTVIYTHIISELNNRRNIICYLKICRNKKIHVNLIICNSVIRILFLLPSSADNIWAYNMDIWCCFFYTYCIMYCLNICEVKYVLLFLAAISQHPWNCSVAGFLSLLYPCYSFFHFLHSLLSSITEKLAKVIGMWSPRTYIYCT